MKYIVVLIASIFIHSVSSAQIKRPFFSDTLRSVTIDSNLTITAKRGLDMSDFVEVMINDTAFYQAFKNLRKFSFTANNTIKTFTDDDRIQGKIIRKIKHDNSTKNYKQTELLKIDSGKVFKKNGDFDLYTVRMFSYIFMNEKNTDYTEQKNTNKKESDEEGYK